MIRATHISKSYRSNTVLADSSFSIEAGNKIALVGPNGVGKTTLLKVMAGLIETDTGEIKITEGTVVSYIPQDIGTLGNDDEHQTVIEYVEKVTATYKANTQVVISILDAFGISTSVQQKVLKSLSSGQKTKVALSLLLIQNPDIMLLDEPTNNLDLASVYVLEEYVKQTKSAVVVVSHDRQFVDNITTKIFELNADTHELTMVGGTYSSYIERKEKAFLTAVETFKNQEEEINRLTETAHNLRRKSVEGSMWEAPDNDKMARGFNRNKAGRSGAKANRIEKQIEQMDKIEEPEAIKPFSIKVDATHDSGSLDIIVRDLIIGYEDGAKKFMVGPITLDIRYGNRVAFIGENGTGKSTLLKVLTENLKQISGDVLVGSGIRIGNLMQEHENLPRTETLLGYMKEHVNLDDSESYNMLQKFGFKESQVKNTIDSLSPGGRARLILASFASEGVNTLVLDEPTNHLDMEALDALQKTLEHFKGTIIAVSHDRFFLQTLHATSIYMFEDGKVNRLQNFDSYIEAAKKKAGRVVRLVV